MTHKTVTAMDVVYALERPGRTCTASAFSKQAL